MLDRPRVRSGMFNMRPGTFRSVLLCIKYYTCTYLYETRTKINIDILDCIHLCSGSASDTYIRRELAPHKRYNVCTRLEFSCWFGLIPVSCKQTYIARNYAIQLSFSLVSIHISVLICSYFYLFVSDRSVREICIYKKRGKVVLEIARTKHVRKHE